MFAHNFSTCAPRAVLHSRVRLSNTWTNVVDVYQIYGPAAVDASVDGSFRVEVAPRSGFGWIFYLLNCLRKIDAIRDVSTNKSIIEISERFQ